MDVNGAPPSGGSTFKNTISKEDFAALLAQSKPDDTQSNSNSNRAAVLNAESWLKDSSSGSGRFIALPLSMILLRKSKAKLSLNELLVLAYIHGFQRRDSLKGCRSNAKTIAEVLGISPSALSKRLQKLKSFALIELCIAIAEGTPWLGRFSCAQGKGLYINLELDRASCLHRFKDVYTALDIAPANLANIDIWNLRGASVPMDKLAPKLIRRAQKKGYLAVILDPIYKVITGDENSADQMANFCTIENISYNLCINCWLSTNKVFLLTSCKSEFHQTLYIIHHFHLVFLSRTTIVELKKNVKVSLTF